jgi:hypothetical protein
MQLWETFEDHSTHWGDFFAAIGTAQLEKMMQLYMKD